MKVKVLTAALGVAVAVLAVALAVVLLGDDDTATTPVAQATSNSPSATSDPDPAVAACELMAKHKRAGTQASEADQAQQIKAFAKSNNTDLRAAAKALAAEDITAIADVMSQLYDGCAAVGVPLE